MPESNLLRPRIALPAATSADLEYNRQNTRSYVDSLHAAGADAVEIPLHSTPAALSALLARCDGVLLPGSPADVDPSAYGHLRDAASAPADSFREQTDRILLDDAYQAGKPVLGICFGLQMLNVYHGGTLIQDLSVLPVNHAAGKSVLVAHTAQVEASSKLGQVTQPAFTPDARLPINSSHHQAVGIAGTSLRVVARCPQDGVVEAIEAEGDHFVVAVQWHPERTPEDVASKALFRAFITACTNRH